MLCLEIIYRKADVKKNHNRGWELLLSHNFETKVTTAFCKGAPSSKIVESVEHLKASCFQIGHPMLFPMIIFSHYHSPKIEIRQRDARVWLRKIEAALSFKEASAPVVDADGYIDENGLIDFDHINRDLTQCNTMVLDKSPSAYVHILDGFEEAMALFNTRMPFEAHESTSVKTNSKIASRINFYRQKLQGQEHYQSITLQRLDAQRSAVSPQAPSLKPLLINFELSVACSQIDNRVGFQIAEAQTKLAHSSRREAVSQKVIAILGTVFLPGAYLSVSSSHTTPLLR